MVKLAAAEHRFWALILMAAAAVPAARGVWLDMPSSGKKCVYEELRSNVVVLANYYSFYGDGNVNYTATPTITVEVSSPHGKDLYHKEVVRYGQFGFTTDEPGYYMACFEVDGGDDIGKNVSVSIDWKVGIAAKDWDSIAKKENIEGLDLELTKLQDIVKYIRERMMDLMRKEFEMRVVSNQTNARVARYSQISLGVCILVAALQLMYLRRYFRKKKLI